jgi:hypothetical protein
LKLTDVSEVHTAYITRAMNRPDYEGSMHKWNVGSLQRDYTALRARRL